MMQKKTFLLLNYHFQSSNFTTFPIFSLWDISFLWDLSQKSWFQGTYSLGKNSSFLHLRLLVLIFLVDQAIDLTDFIRWCKFRAILFVVHQNILPCLQRNTECIILGVMILLLVVLFSYDLYFTSLNIITFKPIIWQIYVIKAAGKIKVR